MPKGSSNGPSTSEGGLKSRSGNGAKAPSKIGSSKPGMEPERLSDSDHRILEDTIRKSVSKIVDAGHPDDHQQTSGESGGISRDNTAAGAKPAPGPVGVPHLQDIGDGKRLIRTDNDPHLYPENDPLARALPSAREAIAYRTAVFDAINAPDPQVHRKLIEELFETGIPMQTLGILLFAPVSARLGMRWCDDDDDFIQVAIAATRLNLCINQLSQRAAPSVGGRRKNRTVLLARTPGATHTLGVSIVAACFRDLGWHVDGGSDLEIGETLFERMVMQKYDLLGISIGALADRMACAGAIVQVRAEPSISDTKIAVGGPAVVQDRQAFETIGADIIASSVLEAIQLADKLAS